jgi:hypothetical protein
MAVASTWEISMLGSNKVMHMEPPSATANMRLPILYSLKFIVVFLAAAA